MGHMNVMWYTGKFDEASWVLLAHLGLTQSKLKDAHRGMAAVQQNITYKKELHAGDVVTIRTRILDVREKVMRFVHEMIKEPTLETAAIAELTGVHMDARRRKSIEFPPEIVANVRELISAQKEEPREVEELVEVVPAVIGELDTRRYTIPAGVGYTSLCE